MSMLFISVSFISALAGAALPETPCKRPPDLSDPKVSKPYYSCLKKIDADCAKNEKLPVCQFSPTKLKPEVQNPKLLDEPAKRCFFMKDGTYYCTPDAVRLTAKETLHQDPQKPLPTVPTQTDTFEDNEGLGLTPTKGAGKQKPGSAGLVAPPPQPAPSGSQ
jgi:hypothetical protein